MGLVALAVLPCLAAEGDAGKWEASASLGVSVTRGNSETLAVNPELRAQRKWSSNEWLLRALNAYAENDEGVTERNGKAISQYNRLFTQRDYGYLNGEIGYDQMANVNYRAMVGPGAGHYFFKGAKFNCSIELGATWIAEELEIEDEATGTTESDPDDRIAIRAAQKADVAIGASAKAWESVEYLPQVDDFDVYLLNAEVGIEAAVSGNLSLKVVAQNRYNSDPAPDTEENDTALKASLVYKFAR
jgi:putative salt-induced outer membrane protein YdiY